MEIQDDKNENIIIQNNENSNELNKNKHSLYQKTVQNPKREVEFFRKTYRMIFKTIPTIFREDFCGTALLSCEWVKNNVCNIAVGIDIDEFTINWGIENNVYNLSSGSERIRLIAQNVLEEFKEKTKFDIICSMNYSHFLLHKRNDLVKYFKNVKRNLERGLFICDFFGGYHLFHTHTHKNQSDNYKCRIEQINIINNQSITSLNFKNRENQYETLFKYCFRIYSLIELKEALEDAGFNKFKIFIKDVSDDEENTFNEYEEFDFDEEYFPKLERYNGYLISIVK
jgi:SAM-dependent methyltransferase